MTDRMFLMWIHERLTQVHGESPFFDYMHRLREIIASTPKDQHLTGKVAMMTSMDVLDEIRAASTRAADKENR